MRVANLVGPMISKLRYQRGWRQDDLVARMQVLGCSITRDVLANIETRRSPVTDQQILFFCAAFSVAVADIYAAVPMQKQQMVGVLTQSPTRRKPRPKTFHTLSEA